jgi:hypothetical protein
MSVAIEQLAGEQARLAVPPVARGSRSIVRQVRLDLLEEVLIDDRLVLSRMRLPMCTIIPR